MPSTVMQTRAAEFREALDKRVLGETQNGASANAAYNSVYQQAVTEGVSVFVAAGDSGASGCDNNVAAATFGIAVNAFASTPYNVAVGGTDFSDTYSKTNNLYWNSTTRLYVRLRTILYSEIPWNDSCASALIANYVRAPTSPMARVVFATVIQADPSFQRSLVAAARAPALLAHRLSAAL